MQHFVVVLGSAQDGGLPQLGSFHANDLKAITEESFRRTGASLAVISSEGHCLLLDASPDLRYQYFQTLLKIPSYKNAQEGKTRPIFDGVVLTHAHIGHYSGLIHLGKEAANTNNIPTYVTPSMAQFLQTNAPWKQLITCENIKLNEVVPLPFHLAQPITVWEGLTIKLFAIPHRAEFTDTIGISINDFLLYIPDIDAWELLESAEEIFKHHKLALVDATFYDKSELHSISRSIQSIPHPSVLDTIARFQHLTKDHKIVLTHINHSNPISDRASPEYKNCINNGFFVANDNSVFELQ